MKRGLTFFLILLISGIVAGGCGKDDGGKPSARSQLEKLQPANVSDPAVLADAAGSAVAMSRMGTDMSMGIGMGMMSALKTLKIPVLKGSRLGLLQVGEGTCTGDQNHFTCTEQCYISGSVTLDCSGNQTSGTCRMTYNNCQDSSDEPPANGYIQINAKVDANGNGTYNITIDVTAGKGFVYGTYNLSLTSSGTGATVKQTLDISGADDSEPDNIGYIYFDETITMQDIGNYEFKATVNGTGAFGTTKQGKVDIAINNVVIDPSTCWMEPVSGTITVSAGGSSVTVTFDGGTSCDGKAKCSGAFNGEIDISGSTEPIIDF